MKILMKENYGNINKLKDLGRTKKYAYTIEQILDKDLKNEGGESRTEVTNRMLKSLNRILDESKGKKVVIVSHGAAINFLLMQWCEFNKNNNVIYNNKVITVNSPGVLELIFDEKKLINLRQII